VDGVNAIVLRFQERDKPRVVETKDDAAARGRFWIEPVGDLRSGGAMGGTTLTIEGTATHGGFRRFGVDATTIIR
jgi:hypothetical protein